MKKILSLNYGYLCLTCISAMAVPGDVIIENASASDGPNARVEGNLDVVDDSTTSGSLEGNLHVEGFSDLGAVGVNGNLIVSGDVNDFLDVTLAALDNGIVYFGTASSLNPFNGLPEGAGGRFVWYPQKNAMRIGSIFNDPSVEVNWDDINIGNLSMAWGQNTIASGSFSTAWGTNTVASGSFSTAWGYYSAASGTFSSAGGASTAAGYGSYSYGYFTEANARLSTVIGSYNVGSFTDNGAEEGKVQWFSQDPLFEIGNSNDSNNRSNALTVLKSGQVGIGLWGSDLHSYSAKLRVAGEIESTSGGIRLPDGTLISSASDVGNFNGGASFSDQVTINHTDNNEVPFTIQKPAAGGDDFVNFMDFNDDVLFEVDSAGRLKASSVGFTSPNSGVSYWNENGIERKLVTYNDTTETVEVGGQNVNGVDFYQHIWKMASIGGYNAMDLFVHESVSNSRGLTVFGSNASTGNLIEWRDGSGDVAGAIHYDGKAVFGDTTALEQVNLDGAIRLGSTVTENAGTIRWNGTDFEGFDGTSWVSLTSSTLPVGPQGDIAMGVFSN